MGRTKTIDKSQRKKKLVKLVSQIKLGWPGNASSPGQPSGPPPPPHFRRWKDENQTVFRTLLSCWRGVIVQTGRWSQSHHTRENETDIFLFFFNVDVVRQTLGDQTGTWNVPISTTTPSLPFFFSFIHDVSCNLQFNVYTRTRRGETGRGISRKRGHFGAHDGTLFALCIRVHNRTYIAYT